MSKDDFKAPINFEYIEMSDLNTKDITDRGFKPEGVGLRTHQNSMYGFVNGKTYGFKENVKVPENIALARSGKPVSYNVYNKNSWGFDETYFGVSGKSRCLEKLAKYINNENLKMVKALKETVKDIFNLDIPEDAEIRQLEVFICYLSLIHMETGKKLFWQRKNVNSKVKKDGKIPGLVLMKIDNKTVNGKKGQKIYETDLWEVGRAFTDESDNFCLLGNKEGFSPVCK
jgi:hypothetical protein